MFQTTRFPRRCCKARPRRSSARMRLSPTRGSKLLSDRVLTWTSCTGCTCPGTCAHRGGVQASGGCAFASARGQIRGRAVSPSVAAELASAAIGDTRRLREATIASKPQRSVQNHLAEPNYSIHDASLPGSAQPALAHPSAISVALRTSISQLPPRRVDVRRDGPLSIVRGMCCDITFEVLAATCALRGLACPFLRSTRLFSKLS